MKGRRLRAITLVILIAGMTLSPGWAPSSASAQAPTPRPSPVRLQAGDILWTFAFEPPIFDNRVATALARLMDARVRTAAGPSSRIVPVVVHDLGIEPLALFREDVQLLLRAGGYPSNPPFVEVGPCRIWAASDTGVAGVILGQALREALASLNVRIQPCTITNRTADAHLLVWHQGSPPPAIPRRQQPTFLAGPELVPSSTRAPANQTGAATPRLPVTGVGAPAGDTMMYTSAFAAAAVMVLLAALPLAVWRQCGARRRQDVPVTGS